MIRTVGIPFMLLLAASKPVLSEEIGDPAAGLKLAQEVCASCHAVSADRTRSPNPRAPSFERIATVPGMTAMALTVALQTSHRTMPNIMLGPQETRDVIAYILSLKE